MQCCNHPNPNDLKCSQQLSFTQTDASQPPGVVGFDVAGDEGSFPLHESSHTMAAGLAEAVNLGVPVTVHAGEWPEKTVGGVTPSVENVGFAVRAGAKRIGHGIALR